MPPDLARALSKTPRAKQAFDAMSPAHRREWIKAVIEAKKPETRTRRIANAVRAMLERSG